MSDHKGMISSKLVPMFLVLVLICMECYFVFVSGDEVRCLEREREALLTFKQGLVDEYGRLTSWGSEDAKKECCDWDGVECSNTTGHVTALLLPAGFYTSKKLVGNISSALLELHHLNNLGLSGIDFGGSRIPESIGSMNKLQHLNLYRANFSGVVPPKLGNLANIRTLDLSYNDLSGSIPPQLGNLTYLKTLDLSNNHLVGLIPDVFGKLVSLEHLDLSRNMLEGGIPKSLRGLSNLRNLFLSDNYLGEPPTADWNGLTCEAMVSLEIVDLSDNNLTEPVPYLNSWFALKKLYLRGNNLKRLPASLGQFSELEVLDVSSNSLEGAISRANLTKLYKLRFLDLSFNPLLTIHITPSWTPPFQLSLLSLVGCNNTGQNFPMWIKTQSNVSWLDLSWAGLSGDVPKWFWSFSTALNYLNLSHNHLSGTIPAHFSSIAIHTVDLSYNKFSGPIPLLHPNIWIFQVSQNMFSGTISSLCTILGIDNLILLDLSNNQLAGELPKCWDKLSGLASLSLANNSFSGEIPHALGSLTSLQALHLRNNNLSGKLPSTLKNCSHLRLIDIGGNKLTGNIPAWIGANYTQMTHMIFRQNRFYGSIPLEICNLTQIQVLDLSRNDLSGKIPRCFNNFTRLLEKDTTDHTVGINFDLGSDYASHIWDFRCKSKSFVAVYIDPALVQWKGRESEYRKTLGLLKLIDLSSNRLVGNIPGEFSGLKGLISLNLSRNGLTGNMNPDIGQMEMLECLDLSRNQLSGEIPIDLAQLHFLAVLDLANNNLSGKIPSGTQLQNFDASVYAGNSELCGLPLALCPGEGLVLTTTNQGEPIKEKDDGFMSLSFLGEFCISMAFGFIVGFWGVVGSLLLKKSWRIAYFNFMDDVGHWLYVTTIMLLRKLRRS